MIELYYWVVIKWLMVACFGLYTAFAVMVIKQVSVMRETLNGGIEFFLTVLSWVHLVVALLLVWMAIVIL
jgi:hypothetical protein